MIGLLLPFNLDTNTVSQEFRNKPIYVYPTAITRLYEETVTENLEDFNLLSFLKYNNTYTQLDDLDSVNIEIASTWKDIIDEDFDVVSRLNLSNSIKMKVKIKSITKFIPKIVID